MTLNFDGATSVFGGKMPKKEEKSFRIVIDKRIVIAFNEIPETFNIKQLTEVAKIPPEEQKSVYDVLERMVSMDSYISRNLTSVVGTKTMTSETKMASKDGCLIIISKSKIRKTTGLFAS